MATEPTNWEKRIQLAVDRWYWTPKGTAGTEQLPKFIVTLLREFAEEAAGIIKSHATLVGSEHLHDCIEVMTREILSMLPKKEG